MLRRTLANFWHRLHLTITGESPRTFFDVFNDKALARLLAQHRLPPLELRGDEDWSAVLTYLAREDLWQAMPLALTPAGARDFIVWCGQHGASWGATVASAIASLRKLHREPDYGLALSYRFRPTWQRDYPTALSQNGWPSFLAAVAKQTGCNGRWLRSSQCPSDMPLSVAEPGGVNLIAAWRYVSGLQEEATQFRRALEAANRPLALRATPSPPRMGSHAERGYEDFEQHAITIVKAGAMEPFDATFIHSGLYPRMGVYRIAAWSWELEQFPKQQLATATLANEFWTPSEFSAMGLRAVVQDRPVVVMPPAVTVPAVQPLPRSKVNAADDQTLFLFTFDLSSVLERKNPLGLLAAFRQAFTTSRDAKLLLKINRADAFPEQFARIQEAAVGLNVEFLTGVWPRQHLMELFAACDCFVSLHRSEGFGYTLAEAMLLGKPVIATDYSATAEFLTADTGLSVGFKFVELKEDYGPYKAGNVWAEPEIPHAAERMHWVHSHREEARQIGTRAAAAVAERFSVEAFKQRLLNRLKQIEVSLPQ